MSGLAHIALGYSQQHHDSGADLTHDAPIDAHPRVAHSLNDGSHAFLAPRLTRAPNGPRPPRRRLAMRTEIAASSGHDRPPYLRPAAKTRLALAAVRAVSLLVFSGLAFGIHKIRDRRTAILDGLLQHAPNRLSQPLEFSGIQPRSQPRRMNARLP